LRWNKSAWSRLRAAEILGEIGDSEAVEYLIEALKDTDEAVRWNAAKALGKIRDNRAVDPLTDALEDTDESVRRNAYEALGKLGDPKTKKRMVEGLKAREKNIRNQAAENLERMKWIPKTNEQKAYYWLTKLKWDQLVILGKPAVEPLIEALTGQLELESPEAKLSVAETLTRIGDGRGEKYLIENLTKSKPREAHKLLRLDGNNNRDNFSETVAAKLGHIGWKTSANAVLDYLFKHPDDRRKSVDFCELFEDYAELIITVTGYKHWKIQSGYEYAYSLDNCMGALQHLSTIHTPIANNILHKVLLMPNYEVPGRLTDGGWELITLSFELLRNAAQAELEQRSNPKHNENAYLADGSWKLLDSK